VPSPALETSLSLPFATIVPKDLAGMTPEEFGQNPIGTGPFKVASWERGQRLTLVRNDSYWDTKRPFLDKVIFEVVPSDSSRAQQLRGGALDVIATPPRPQLEALDRAPGTKVGQYALAFPYYLALNQRSKIFADPRVREAVDLGVDRDSIRKAAVSGVGELAGSFLAPAVRYYDKSLEPVLRKPERARELLAEAVADGVNPRFTLMDVAGNSTDNITAQIIKANLEDIGFIVDIEQVDASAQLSEVAAGNYDATMSALTSDILDPSEVIGFYLDLNALWTGGETTRIRTLLAAANQEPDTEARGAIYRQIQHIVFEDRSLVTLGYQPWIWAMRDEVVGFDVPMTGVPWLADAGFREK
jgi:peptide/nickel transport system substrate-binding protein